MVFVVGVTYDLTSNLEVLCVDVFFSSDILLLLSLPLYNISLKTTT